MRRFTSLATLVVNFLLVTFINAQTPSAYYPLDGNSLAEIGEDATMFGPSPTTDRFGAISGALNFDGVDDYVLLPDSILYEKIPFTISIWFKTETDGGIFGYASGTPLGNPASHVGTLYVGESGVLRGKYWDNVTTTMVGPTVNNGGWHQAVLTRNASGQKLYLDGEYVAERNAMTFDGNMAKSYIGVSLTKNWVDSPQGYFYLDGCLDDLRLFEVELSAEQIWDMYAEDSGEILDEECILCSTSSISVGQKALSPHLGLRNVALGAYAGYESMGSGNVFLGYRAGEASEGSNALIIGNGEFTPLVKGDFEARTFGVDGEIITREVTVDYDNWPDFVFNRDYKLLPLKELERFLEENKHLPGVPSQEEIHADGINLGEMDATLLQKIEELTLYMIELRKENEDLKIRYKEIEERLKELEK